MTNPKDTEWLRQQLLDLLSQYQNLEKPVAPDILKIFIEDTEDKINGHLQKEIVRARIDELNGCAGVLLGHSGGIMRKEEAEKMWYHHLAKRAKELEDNQHG